MRRALGLLLALGCAPEELAVDPTGAVEAFAPLHARVYEAWALDLDRDALHAHLAEAFVGEALTREYVEHWRTRARMAEDGTGIVVTGVEHEEVTLLDDPEAVRVDATWLVRGVVRHRQHRHPRINRYRAVYTLVSTAEGWRIADTRMKDLARVATEVDPLDVFDDEAGSAAAEGFMDPMELLEAGLFDTDAPDPEAP